MIFTKGLERWISLNSQNKRIFCYCGAKMLPAVGRDVVIPPDYYQCTECRMYLQANEVNPNGLERAKYYANKKK